MDYYNLREERHKYQFRSVLQRLFHHFKSQFVAVMTIFFSVHINITLTCIRDFLVWVILNFNLVTL